MCAGNIALIYINVKLSMRLCYITEYIGQIDFGGLSNFSHLTIINCVNNMIENLYDFKLST